MEVEQSDQGTGNAVLATTAATSQPSGAGRESTGSEVPTAIYHEAEEEENSEKKSVDLTKTHYKYTKLRSAFGKQTQFLEDRPRIHCGLRANTTRYHPLFQQKSFVDKSEDTLKALRDLTNNTGRAEYRDFSVLHTEGGWPREINVRDHDVVEKTRRKLQREESFIDAVPNLAKEAEYLVKHNNTLGLCEPLNKRPFEQKRDTKPNASVVTVYKCPTPHAKRPVSRIMFAPGNAGRMAVAYCPYEFDPTFREHSCEAFFWEVENPTRPEGIVRSAAQIVDLQYHPMDVHSICGALFTGQVCTWDNRVGPNPQIISSFETSHEDVCTNARWTDVGKGSHEFFSAGLDGGIIWWDERNLSSRVDTAYADVEIGRNDPKQAVPITVLEYDSIFKNKFIVGTQFGQVVPFGKGIGADTFLMGILQDPTTISPITSATTSQRNGLKKYRKSSQKLLRTKESQDQTTLLETQSNLLKSQTSLLESQRSLMRSQKSVHHQRYLMETHKKLMEQQRSVMDQHRQNLMAENQTGATGSQTDLTSSTESQRLQSQKGLLEGQRRLLKSQKSLMDRQTTAQSITVTQSQTNSQKNLMENQKRLMESQKSLMERRSTIKSERPSKARMGEDEDDEEEDDEEAAEDNEGATTEYAAEMIKEEEEGDEEEEMDEHEDDEEEEFDEDEEEEEEEEGEEEEEEEEESETRNETFQVLSVYQSHRGPVTAIQRNPAFPGYFMSCGGYHLRVYSEDVLDSGIMWTSPSESLYSYCQWLLGRPCCLVSSRIDGCLEFWDLLTQGSSSILTTKICEEALSTVCPSYNGRLVAAGTVNGDIRVVQVCPFLASFDNNDYDALGQLFYREARREHHLANRMEKMRTTSPSSTSTAISKTINTSSKQISKQPPTKSKHTGITEQAAPKKPDPYKNPDILVDKKFFDMLAEEKKRQGVNAFPDKKGAAEAYSKMLMESRMDEKKDPGTKTNKLSDAELGAQQLMGVQTKMVEQSDPLSAEDDEEDYLYDDNVPHLNQMETAAPDDIEEDDEGQEVNIDDEDEEEGILSAEDQEEGILSAEDQEDGILSGEDEEPQEEE